MKGGPEAAQARRMERIHETSLQQTLIEYLRMILVEGFVAAIPNAARRSEKDHALNAVPGLFSGMPDLVVVVRRRVIWLEVKTGKGRLSEQQASVHALLRDLDHDVFTVRNIEEVREALAAAGIRTRETPRERPTGAIQRADRAGAGAAAAPSGREA